MDCNLDPSWPSFVDVTGDVNFDEFHDFDNHIDNPDTALLIPNPEYHQAPGSETTDPSQTSYCESASYGPGSQYSQNSYSTPSNQTSEGGSSQDYCLDTDIYLPLPLFDPELSSYQQGYQPPLGTFSTSPYAAQEFHFSFPPTIGAMPSNTNFENSSQAYGASSVAPAPAEIPRPPPASSASSRRRKRKNPEELKKNRRKVNKPVICPVCNKGYAWDRDRNRHLVARHTAEAALRGIDTTSMIQCEYEDCEYEVSIIRKDRLKKHMKVHMKKKHG